jgi:hypothetical protein
MEDDIEVLKSFIKAYEKEYAELKEENKKLILENINTVKYAKRFSNIIMIIHILFMACYILI